jgi:hypothetical protein
MVADNGSLGKRKINTSGKTLINASNFDVSFYPANKDTLRLKTYAYKQ